MTWGLLLLGLGVGLSAPGSPTPTARSLRPPAGALPRPPAPPAPRAACVAPLATETAIEGELRVVTETFAAVDRAAETRDVETLIGWITRLRVLRAAASPAARAVIDRELAKRTTASCFGAGGALKLHMYVNDGNRHLRALAGYVRRGEVLLAHDRLKLVEALFFEMRGEKRPVFHRNADALLKRARQLYRRALGSGNPARLKRTRSARSAGAGLQEVTALRAERLQPR